MTYLNAREAGQDVATAIVYAGERIAEALENAFWYTVSDVNVAEALLRISQNLEDQA